MNTSKLLILSLVFACQSIQAAGLQVFDRKYCSNMTAGSCVNFNVKTHAAATNFFGKLKYPAGAAAWNDCIQYEGGDSGIAECALRFHYAEQDEKTRKSMCHHSVRDKYRQIASPLAVRMYDSIWNCR